MKNFWKRIFSIQKKGKYEKKICFLGLRFKTRNYRFMIYDMFRKQNTERIRSFLKDRNITLPYDALFTGDVQIVEVALKDIRREWKGKLYSLYEVSPYKYLETRDKSIYRDYFEKQIGPISDEASEAILESLLNLEKSIKENGYDPSRSIICLNENNVVSDGQRRACILLHLYGGDYKAKVAREYN